MLDWLLSGLLCHQISSLSIYPPPAPLPIQSNGTIIDWPLMIIRSVELYFIIGITYWLTSTWCYHPVASAIPDWCWTFLSGILLPNTPHQNGIISIKLFFLCSALKYVGGMHTANLQSIEHTSVPSPIKYNVKYTHIVKHITALENCDKQTVAKTEWFDFLEFAA